MATDQSIRQQYLSTDHRGSIRELATILSVALLRLKAGKSSELPPSTANLVLANGSVQSGYPTSSPEAARNVL